MNRTIQKTTSKETLFTIAQSRENNTADNNVFPQRWERKLADAMRADYLKPRDKAVNRILELAKNV